MSTICILRVTPYLVAISFSASISGMCVTVIKAPIISSFLLRIVILIIYRIFIIIMLISIILLSMDGLLLTILRILISLIVPLVVKIFIALKVSMIGFVRVITSRGELFSEMNNLAFFLHLFLNSLVFRLNRLGVFYFAPERLFHE
jgi:hypothetical protein